MGGGFEARVPGGFEMRIDGGFEARLTVGIHANTHPGLIDLPSINVKQGARLTRV